MLRNLLTGLAMGALIGAAYFGPAMADGGMPAVSASGRIVVTGSITAQGSMFRDSFGTPVDPSQISIAKRGYWGTGAVIKTGPTSNDQYDPYDPRDGSYTNTGGARDWTYRQQVGGKGLARIGVVDWGDRVNGEKAKIDVTVRFAAGDTQKVGTVSLTGRRPSGDIMGLKVKSERKIAAVSWHFTQPNPRDIVGVVDCNCRAAATLSTSAKARKAAGKSRKAR